MPLAIIFILFAALCAAAFVRGESATRYVWLWPAASFALVAAAYAGLGARLLGKQPTGSIHPIARLLHWPSHLLAGATWHAASFIRGSHHASRVAERLWVGRRPRGDELPADVQYVVDLTCEFPRDRRLPAHCQYRSFPILDGHVPPLPALVALARNLARQPATLYIHCAQGHGRAAMVAACVLMARGEADSPSAALKQIRSARPRIRLSPAQRAMLDRVAEVLKA